MRYEGPIYRPPSEANSLLIQATVGCPHNRCTFCLVYKDDIAYKVRDITEIKEDMQEAADDFGEHVTTLFFPAGNSIAMDTNDLSEICKFAHTLYPNLDRITVYGSSQYIYQKGLEGMKQLAKAGLSRIHVGLESGNDKILKRIKKGTTGARQIQAGKFVMEAGIELSLYVMLGIGGQEDSALHIADTVNVLNQISPTFIRLRTFVPKKNTELLEDVLDGSFSMLGPHGILNETKMLVQGLAVDSYLTSDHYTNYVNIDGKLPHAKAKMLARIEDALDQEESTFRPFFIGDQ